MKFRKKPVVIEAFCLGLHSYPEWFYERNDFEIVLLDHHDVVFIETLEGRMKAEHGDWIIKGIKGEIYPCKSDIFEATYEAVP